jgi:hypothetical protein
MVVGALEKWVREDSTNFNELHFSRHRRVPAARCSIFTVKTVAQVRGHACATSRDYETATQATTASDVLFYRIM